MDWNIYKNRYKKLENEIKNVQGKIEIFIVRIFDGHPEKYTWMWEKNFFLKKSWNINVY